VKAFYCDHFVLPLPEGHRFPMEKYSRLRERVLAAGVVAPEELIVPHAATDEEILRAHDAEYLRRVVAGELDRAEARRIGFPWSPAMVERSRRSAGGTIEACRAALEEGAAVNLAGGTHHAFRDRGEGYCVFNDAASASRAMQAEGRVERVVVIDCDVHQGNGTASIFEDDPTVFTFSIHGRNNFPFHKERSDLDVELPRIVDGDTRAFKLQDSSSSKSKHSSNEYNAEGPLQIQPSEPNKLTYYSRAEPSGSAELIFNGGKLMLDIRPFFGAECLVYQSETNRGRNSTQAGPKYLSLLNGLSSDSFSIIEDNDGKQDYVEGSKTFDYYSGSLPYVPTFDVQVIVKYRLWKNGPPPKNKPR